MKVTVYSTPACPWCHRAKEFLKQHSIKFTEINVADDSKAAEEMIAKSGQMGVPVIDVDGQIIIGFDKPRLEKALRLAK